jgi:anti-sigma regulatory factor (Ser/Thr protein kinase)
MEAINNVLEHALTGKKDQRIVVVCKIEEECIFIEVFDRGLQMTERPSLKMPALYSEQGRGWNILRRWMDEVSYRRHRGENRLRLKKHIYATTK